MVFVLQTTPVVVLARSAGISQFRSLRKQTIRCSAKPQEDAKEAASVNVPPPPQATATPTPAPKVQAKASTKFSDLLAFSGPAPERINGRLAMIGFVGALAAEIASGQDLFTQISNGGVAVFLGTSVVLSVASLIPLFQGVTVESKSDGVMTSDAELLNGRVAMLGLVALAFTEYVKGGAFV